MSEASELENRVPVMVLVTVGGDYDGLAGDDRVGDGEDLVGSLETRVVLTCADRKAAGPLEVM